ncbi:MAG: radical SAM protein [Dorea sp.]|nr:radical SAM protein [Dorea sp.]
MEPMADASSYEQRLMDRAWSNKIPMNASIELLPLCNMNCDMCYVRLSRKEMEGLGRMRTASEWLEVGRQMQKAGVLFLLLTGGEPLLHPEFKEIYLGLRSMGMILTLNTNGTLIDEEWADFFAENPPRRINISLYGSSRETYERLCHYADGYDKTIHAVKLLKERQVDVRLGCSITNENLEDLEGIYKLQEELEIFTISDPYMVAATREREKDFAYEVRCHPEKAAENKIYGLKKMIGEEAFPSYVKQKVFEVQHILPGEGPGRVTCYAGNCSFAISWLGDMHPCVTMYQPSANVFELGVEKAWEYLKDEVSKILTSERCNQCNLRPVCSTCAGNCLVETGAYDQVSDYICRMAKETYRLLLIEAEKLEDEAKV